MKPRIRTMVVLAFALALVTSACGASTDGSADAAPESSVQLKPSTFCEEWSEVIAFGEARDNEQPPKTLAEAESMVLRWQSLLDDAAAVAPPELDVPMETMQRLAADLGERELEKFRDDAPRSEPPSLSSATGSMAEAMASRGNIDAYFEASCTDPNP